MTSFEELLGKDSLLLKSINDRGFDTPSEIQEKSIPPILKGKDVIAGASTGSGKTLAFAAGLIKNVEKGKGIQGLILTPTRELAEQVTKEIYSFSKHKQLNVIAVYGGVSIENQIIKLRSTEIVVGTPGRILDHLQRESINLSKVNTLVLDEADRMLDMGFRDDVQKIILNCPKNRQTLLFSATIYGDITYLAEKYMREPIEISAEPLVDPKKLKQVYYDVHDHLKYSLLAYLLKKEDSKLVMIFCNTRRNVDFIANNLKTLGVGVIAIHGGYSQDKRTKIIEEFHSKKVHILVATDVAARGLDIKGVSHIYNYDTPPTKKEYIHRIGRTARAGNDGKVINIIASRDYENFQNVMTGEFDIILEQNPFIKKIDIRWVPERRNSRMGGGYRGSDRRGGRMGVNHRRIDRRDNNPGRRDHNSNRTRSGQTSGSYRGGERTDGDRRGGDRGRYYRR